MCCTLVCRQEGDSYIGIHTALTIPSNRLTVQTLAYLNKKKHDYNNLH